MKQFLAFIGALAIIVIGVMSSCGSHKTVEWTLDPEKTNAYQEDSNYVDEGTEFASVSEYLNYFKKVEGEIVTVPGLLNDDNICGFFDESDEYVNIKTDGIEGFDNIHRNCKVYATGKSCIDNNGDPYIDLNNLYYYEAFTEPYWSNSTLITDENILSVFSSGVDPSDYYEFTAVPSWNNEYLQVIGLNDASIIQNNIISYNLPDNGDVCQVLITDIKFTEDGICFDVADYIDLETDNY